MGSQQNLIQDLVSPMSTLVIKETQNHQASIIIPSETCTTQGLVLLEHQAMRCLTTWSTSRLVNVSLVEACHTQSESMCLYKAAKSVTFDLLILEIKFLFFKNAVKILKFR